MKRRSISVIGWCGSLLGVVGLAACGGDNGTGPAAVSYAGEWSGTTSQNLPLYFRVNQSGQIDSLTARLRMNFGTFTCTATFPATPPIAISGGGFNAAVTLPITNVSTTLHGTFSSEASATGSWDAYSQNWFITCGTTVAFGSGGTALSAGSWTAQKQ
ncbi:MAG: hypothetical protein ACREMW_02670, partial [Gemmatimonadales bacterium]